MLFFKSIGMMLLPFLLIMKEPDLGSALVLVPTGLALDDAAGVPKKYLAWMIGGVGCLAALLLVDVLFAPPKGGKSNFRSTSGSVCWFISGGILPRAGLHLLNAPKPRKPSEINPTRRGRR